ncbi:MAG: type VI secretion system-associated FHA domain protein TagH [Burkholderiales bacterium]
MLTITVVRFKDRPVDPPAAAEFREQGGTIGRSPESTLVLADPDRIISRIHAVVSYAGGRFLLKDQGTTVPVLINGRPVGKGREQVVNAGDELRIGGYAMRIDVARADIVADDTTTILREGAMLSWREDGKPVAQDRIATIIVPEPEGAASAPSASASASVAPPAQRAGTAGPASPSASPNDPMMEALLKGAGVPGLQVPGGLTPQFMEDVGAIMRESMKGLLDLLAARAHAKREVRADATIIVANDNNPLKFSPGLDAAVAHLLTPKGQGFMSPQRSLVDARESLRTHQEGFVAGMQAALAAVLARFDPAKLEARLLESSSSGSFLAMNQKAKLWNLYEELYGQISRESETDFHFLFGEEFLRAYKEKTRSAGAATPPGQA